MFNYKFRTNFELTETIETYVKSKIDKLQKYIHLESNVSVNLLVDPDKLMSVEIGIVSKDVNFRAKHTDKDLYGAIDLVEEKLERQARKNKTKNKSNVRKHSGLHDLFVSPEDLVLDAESEI